MISKFRIFILFVLGISNLNATDQFVIEELTNQSLSAHENYNFGKVKNNQNSSTAKYSGYAGSELEVKCKYRITIKVTFHKDGTLSGQVYYTGRPGWSKTFSGLVDNAGNINLVEEKKDSRGYIFKGKITEETILGFWSKGNGKKGFCMNAMQK